MCVGMALLASCNNFQTTFPLERKWVNGGMISDSRSLLSAGGCLVVTTGAVASCAVKMNSLAPLGAVVLPLMKITR
jgi:hypothetical protein